MSEIVLSRGHCEGEKGGGQETRVAKVECYNLTLWTFLEVGTIYVAGAKT